MTSEMPFFVLVYAALLHGGAALLLSIYSTIPESLDAPQAEQVYARLMSSMLSPDVPGSSSTVRSYEPTWLTELNRPDSEASPLEGDYRALSHFHFVVELGTTVLLHLVMINILIAQLSQRCVPLRSLPGPDR